MAKKFIDADLLKEKIEQNCDMQDLYLPIHFFDKVDEMPAADVMPVIHAKWKKTTSCGEINGLEIPKEHTVFRCSECGYEFEHEGYLAYFSYCPCCGARMDGEDE